LGYPYKLVFNGEIYNYIEIRQELQYLGINFQTKSDTEVLLQAYIKWGENCLEKFNGMFSFEFHTFSNKLFIARGRFGVKPLYFYNAKDTLIFASEIKSIRALISTKVNSTLTNLEKVLFERQHFDKWHERISKVKDGSYEGLLTLDYANLFQAISNKGVKVVLDGQVMHEAWASYDYYQTNSTHTIQGQKSNPFKLNVLNEVFLKEAKEPNYPKPFNDKLLDKNYRDFFYIKIPSALRFNDRDSMAAATELPDPFLDYNLVEYPFSLLKPLKTNKGVGKYLFREILNEYSPEVALSPKRPLQTPQCEWLGNELSSTVDRAINQLEKSIYADYFKIDEMKNEWKDYKNGSQDSSFHLWQFVSVSKLINLAC
jgi:asparagine synthase (glutamine-hydrolysing)